MPQGDIVIYDCFSGQSVFYGYYNPWDPRDVNRCKILYHKSLYRIITVKKQYNIPLSAAETEFCQTGCQNWELLENDPEHQIFSDCCDDLRAAYSTRYEILNAKPPHYLTSRENSFLQKQHKSRIRFDAAAYEALRYWRDGASVEKMWQYWEENSGNAIDLIDLTLTRKLHLAPGASILDSENRSKFSFSISITTELNGFELQSYWLDWVELNCLLFSCSECAPFFFGNTDAKLPLFQVRSYREDESFIIFAFDKPLPSQKTNVPFKSHWRFHYYDLLYKVRQLLQELQKYEEILPPGVPIQTAARENLLYNIETAFQNKPHRPGSYF